MADNYTYDEIQVALTHCGDSNPINWLQENWPKLIETVQTLATKYGQERKENIVGTISAIEAKEALKKHKGNVWHAVTECIEQRQKSFNFINGQGKYLREDIVTYLTVHHGDRELALKDLSRLQLKPFLLNVIGAPAGADNESGNFAIGNTERPFGNDSRSADANTLENIKSEISNANIVNKTDMLKDLETIIGNMEQKQSKQTETILNTIENLLGNIVTNPNRPNSSASNFSTNSYDRIDVKSPIVMQSKDNEFQDEDVENDVKNFMSRHIQDIVPGVAAMVSEELNNATNESVQKTKAKDEAKRLALAKIETESNANMLTAVEQNVDQMTFDEQSTIFNINVQKNEMAIEKIQDPTIIVQCSHHNPPEVRVGEEETKTKSAILQTDDQAKPKPNVMPKFVINKGTSRRNRQYQRAFIRNIEKEMLKKQKSKNSQDEVSIQTTLVETTTEGIATESIRIEGTKEASVSIPTETQPNLISVASNSVHAEPKQQLESESEMTFTMVITEQSQAEAEQIDQSRLSPSAPPTVPHDTVMPSTSAQSQVADTIGPEVQRNFSELFEDTKSLIQQMKNEIDEDIAMSVSEFDEDTEYYESTGSEEYTDYSGEKELSGEEEEEEAEAEAGEVDDVDEEEDVTENEIAADELDEELDDDQSEEWMDTNGKAIQL